MSENLNELLRQIKSKSKPVNILGKQWAGSITRSELDRISQQAITEPGAYYNKLREKLVMDLIGKLRQENFYVGSTPLAKANRLM